MSQPAIVLGALVFAWFFYITTRGDLPKWLGFVGI